MKKAKELLSFQRHDLCMCVNEFTEFHKIKTDPYKIPMINFFYHKVKLIGIFVMIINVTKH